MTRLQRHALAVQMLAEGVEREQVAARLHIGKSGLNSLLSDPDGSKQKARRERYRGTCARCGAKTDGSCGYSSCSVHCAACAAEVRKRWTREAVIEAIRLWASEHDNNPPLSEDWLHASKDGRFPSRGSVYITSSNPSSPFPKWADAIEAAGFERPRVGLYKGRVDWTPERVIEELQAYAAEHGRSPACDAVPNLSYWKVKQFFGSWPQALDAAGLPRNRFDPTRGKVAA